LRAMTAAGQSMHAYAMAAHWNTFPQFAPLAAKNVRLPFFLPDKYGIVRHVFSSQFAADRHAQTALEVIRELTHSN